MEFSLSVEYTYTKPSSPQYYIDICIYAYVLKGTRCFSATCSFEPTIVSPTKQGYFYDKSTTILGKISQQVTVIQSKLSILDYRHKTNVLMIDKSAAI